MAKKIIWSIDPFESSSETRKQVVDTLRAIAKNEAIEIEPVYVLSPESLFMAVESSKLWLEPYKESAEKMIRQITDQAEVSKIAQPKILIQRNVSIKDAVQKLT